MAELSEETKVFPNLARPDDATAEVRAKVTKVAKAELEAAGIEVFRFTDRRSEVPSDVMGSLSMWSFRRAWYYWMAEGPGIPPHIAEKLHATHGKVVRVAGHCGCPSPIEWYEGFAVGGYHIDTQDGLNAFAEMLRLIKPEDVAAINHQQTQITELRDQLGATIAVLEKIQKDPYGCRFCDSGKLRDEKKEHDDWCGYPALNTVLSNLSTTAQAHREEIERRAKREGTIEALRKIPCHCEATRNPSQMSSKALEAGAAIEILVRCTRCRLLHEIEAAAHAEASNEPA